MFLSILAAAAVFTTPSADVHVAMEVNEKLPAWVSRQHNWTAAELEVFADPTGRVLTCKVRRFVPLQEVADEMCKVLIGRQVVPAKNFDDEKSYGLGLMIVVVDEDGESDLVSRLGDLQQDSIVLTVGSLPESLRRTPKTRAPLNLEIGTGGEVLRCEGLKDVPEAFREVGRGLATPARQPFASQGGV